jgi:hypothetical protein
MTGHPTSPLLVLLLAALPLLSQMGRSPVPGGRLPGGSGSSRPGRGAGTGTSQPKQPSAPLASFRGTLRRLTGKVLELQTDNDQTLELRCSGKTKFYRESKKIKAADLKPGMISWSRSATKSTSPCRPSMCTFKRPRSLGAVSSSEVTAGLEYGYTQRH